MRERRLRLCVCLLSVVMLGGCGGSKEAGPPRLVASYRLQESAERFAVGPSGRVYHTTSGRSFMGGPSGGKSNELQVLESGSKPGYPLKLDPGVEIKAVVADGQGLLYLGVREGGKDQVWVFSEEWGSEKPKPDKLTPALPGDLNNLFLGREPGVLYALCGDTWVVKLTTAGAVAATHELPGDSRPEDGGVDAEGNLYIRRTSGPVVKLKPDGFVDREWSKSAAAALDSVRSVAVDSRGFVYIAASEGDIYLRAYTPSGTLAFNVVAEPLKYSPDRLIVTPRDVLYALDGRDVYEFRP